MDAIRREFEKTVKLSEAEWEIFSAHLSRKEFGKKAVLLQKGATENYLSFIEKGVARVYVPGGEAEDRTFGFAFAGDFLSAYDSFIAQSPAEYEIQALSPLVVWRISHAGLQEVYRVTAVGNLIGRMAAETQFRKKARRELSLLNETPETRYRNLFTEQPRLLREIPLKYVASYIGITPQALSRIRRRIS